MQERHPHTPAQKNALSAPCQLPVTSQPISAGAEQRHRDQRAEQPVDDDQVAVVGDVGREPGSVAQLPPEHPADVRVRQALEHGAHAVP